MVASHWKESNKKQGRMRGGIKIAVIPRLNRIGILLALLKGFAQHCKQKAITVGITVKMTFLRQVAGEWLPFVVLWKTSKEQ